MSTFIWYAHEDPDTEIEEYAEVASVRAGGTVSPTVRVEGETFTKENQ